MAFPLSHPAAVLPLTLLPKRYVSATGLIIGSLVPDFEYLLRLEVKAVYANLWPDLIIFNSLMGLLLIFAFHQLIRKPLILNLPSSLRKRFIVFIDVNWLSYFKKHWGVVIISLAMGIASHLFWDSLDLTHNKGHVFRSLYAWTASFAPEGIQMPLIRFIQHFPSLAGLLLIVFYLWKMPVHKVIKAKIHPYWFFLFSGGLGFGLLLVALKGEGFSLLSAGLSFCSGVLLSMCLFPFIRKRKTT
jgi:hypothetical protein